MGQNQTYTGSGSSSSHNLAPSEIRLWSNVSNFSQISDWNPNCKLGLWRVKSEELKIEKTYLTLFVIWHYQNNTLKTYDCEILNQEQQNTETAFNES